MSTDLSPKKIAEEVQRRRTFAIISHPDAGKTTMTEKLLLYGGAIHLAGSVKSRRAAKHAVSDWMEMEQQRGISITSSVLQFPYGDYAINLLDTPGHADFSEDTYRTLAAADSAVMLMDVAKGVEPQTIKLFKVCAMRKLPIFTFVNKMDRYGRPPLELMEEIEDILGIRSCPINWPIGDGKEFKGVYDRLNEKIIVFDSQGSHGESIVEEVTVDLHDPRAEQLLGTDRYLKLLDDIELLDIAGDPFDLERVRAGELTPMFFGSAMTNFGVGPFLKAFVEMAPSPAEAKDRAAVNPTRPEFSGFVFKIQANMNPAHRDRLAFMRITSGVFEKDMQATIKRDNRQVKLAYPQTFMASDREVAGRAFAGDIIGLYDPGNYRIGDTLFTGEPVEETEIPRFSPEHFAVVEIKEALKRKQLTKGLDQLSEEGTIQVFRQPHLGDLDAVVGAVGILQFEVLQHRLENEYKVKVNLRQLNFKHARWVDGEPFDEAAFNRQDYTKVLHDRDDLPIVLFRNDWALNYCSQQNPKLRFLPNPPGTPGLEELHGSTV
ncbi:peptide chain release factor 3 [Bradymonadaceae bacterium TMQ3]|uniref:Peptide chain release factor 3 n=1 Tax=Lujinxingia sediminis TaxID=2480984 RepID=A0ABY0CP18_9DELT|nr:peptide chain release factor 3 [Lujinxingia sediminis]RDV36825.1 peptide chain release factor 3 [Bradymonadaceae bacterium TMQ3]RVU42194.1 peptide chain release factor 3 [Lujinxingia sediminis]TXC69448.1 peptide chain release factor 3 [Bradymonadales bacterium TMQ1]